MPRLAMESPSSPGYVRRHHRLRSSRSTKSAESVADPVSENQEYAFPAQASYESFDFGEARTLNTSRLFKNKQQRATTEEAKDLGDTMSGYAYSSDDRTPQQEERRLAAVTDKPRRSTLPSSSFSPFLEKVRRNSRSQAPASQQHHPRSATNEDSFSILTGDQLPVVNEESNPNFQDLGPLLLKLAMALHLSGENSTKALECATRAVRFLEKEARGKASLDFVTSLHVLAAIHCRLGQYEQALPILKRAITIPDEKLGVDHALAAVAGHMQLGDLLTLLGQHCEGLSCYKTAYQLQQGALGSMDPQVGETCGYVAEAYLKALQYKEAEEMCEHALRIHTAHSPPGTLEETADRRLMALILSGKGDNEKALQQLVLASANLRTNGQDSDVAAVDCSIGDIYVALGRYDEAICSYQKALSHFRIINGDGHTSVAAVYVSLAVLHMKMRKQKESKNYCDAALRIYGRPNAGHSPHELASGLTEIASVFESMQEWEQALFLLQQALDIIESLPGQQNAVAGVEAQMGVLYYCLGKFEEAFMSLKSAVSKLRLGLENKSAQLGIVLNQMGLACVGLNEIWHAADTFEESRCILEETYGPHHTQTLAVCSNLAGAYDALGRSEEAIHLLEHILEVKEERLGTAHPEVEEERSRLAELLRETGKSRMRKTNTLEELLLISNIDSSRCQTRKLSYA